MKSNSGSSSSGRDGGDNAVHLPLGQVACKANNQASPPPSSANDAVLHTEVSHSFLVACTRVGRSVRPSDAVLHTEVSDFFLFATKLKSSWRTIIQPPLVSASSLTSSPN